MQNAFTKAIHDKKKLRVTFFSKEDGHQLTRTCAPMDIGPSRRAADKSDRFHMWDYDSDQGKHTLGLPFAQIVKMEVLDLGFEPADFITWDTKQSPWFIPRDWGNHS